jgi:hypothetical protein
MVIISAVISKILPKEMSLLAKGAIIAINVVIIIKVDSCIDVVRLCVVFRF